MASGSPRRRELLEQIGVEFEVRISGVEERTSAVMPEDVVLELSGLKAEDVAREAPEGSWILGADTVVDGRNMGKPGSHKEACEMIRSLQGRTHQVFTGVTLICKEGRGQKGVSFVEKTDVTLYPMSEEEIREYGESEEPMDKAGAYGIQGRFARYVSRIDGDYSNVVGLPVGRVYQEWKSLVEREEEDD